MIRHIVMWKFRPGTEAEQEQFLNGLRALQGVVPQLLRSEVARNIAPGNYDAVLVSEFQSLEDLDAYKKRFLFESAQVEIQDLMNRLLSEYPVRDLNITEPAIEGIIRRIYGGEEV